MTTLTYGLKLPANGDKGASLWSALSGNITHLDGHTHNGTDSAKLPVQNFTSTKQSISHLNWATFGGPTGHYRQTITIPAGFTFDDFTIDFRTSAGKKIYMGVTKIDNTSYYLYCTDNTLDVVAVYGV